MNQQKLLEYGLKLLARRRYTESGMRQKLLLKKYKLEKSSESGGGHVDEKIIMRNANKNSPHTSFKNQPFLPETPKENNEIEAVIERLKDYRYLDDAEYAKFFIMSQISRSPQGLRLIKQRLTHKGVATELIENALNKYAPDELIIANEARDKKIKLLKGYPGPKQKEKLYRFLISKGFSFDIIAKSLKGKNFNTDSFE